MATYRELLTRLNEAIRPDSDIHLGALHIAQMIIVSQEMTYGEYGIEMLEHQNEALWLFFSLIGKALNNANYDLVDATKVMHAGLDKTFTPRQIDMLTKLIVDWELGDSLFAQVFFGLCQPGVSN